MFAQLASQLSALIINSKTPESNYFNRTTSIELLQSNYKVRNFQQDIDLLK
jgi:hypothetical protein